MDFPRESLELMKTLADAGPSGADSMFRVDSA